MGKDKNFVKSDQDQNTDNLVDEEYQGGIGEPEKEPEKEPE